MVTGGTEDTYLRAEQRVRRAIAFYGATPGPTYQQVFATHGWGDLQSELNTLARQRRWHDMPRLIDDEILQTFATCASPEQLPDLLADRYGDTCRRILLAVPFQDEPAMWSDVIRRTRQLTGT